MKHKLCKEFALRLKVFSAHFFLSPAAGLFFFLKKRNKIYLPIGRQVCRQADSRATEKKLPDFAAPMQDKKNISSGVK